MRDFALPILTGWLPREFFTQRRGTSLWATAGVHDDRQAHGHCSVRDNPGGHPRAAATVASMLKKRGTPLVASASGELVGVDRQVCQKSGFDEFFGYYDQVHAHSFYPPYLIHNSKEVPLAGNDGGRSGETYSNYEIMKRGLDFIRENRDRPFFCYFPITPPHGMYDIPSDDAALKLR